MTELIKQLTELQEKSNRYDNLKTRLDEAEQYLNDAKDLIKKSISIINPVATLKTKNREHSGSKKEIIAEYIQKLRLGQEVRVSDIEKDHPELTKNNITYIFSIVLGKLKEVDYRKEGTIKILYMRKNY